MECKYSLTIIEIRRIKFGDLGECELCTFLSRMISLTKQSSKKLCLKYRNDRTEGCLSVLLAFLAALEHCEDGLSLLPGSFSLRFFSNIGNWGQVSGSNEILPVCALTPGHAPHQDVLVGMVVTY